MPHHQLESLNQNAHIPLVLKTLFAPALVKFYACLLAAPHSKVWRPPENTHVCNEDFCVQRALGYSQPLQKLYGQAVGVVVLEIAAIVAVRSWWVIEAANMEEKKMWQAFEGRRQSRSSETEQKKSPHTEWTTFLSIWFSIKRKLLSIVVAVSASIIIGATRAPSTAATAAVLGNNSAELVTLIAVIFLHNDVAPRQLIAIHLIKSHRDWIGLFELHDAATSRLIALIIKKLNESNIADLASEQILQILPARHFVGNAIKVEGREKHEHLCRLKTTPPSHKWQVKAQQKTKISLRNVNSTTLLHSLAGLVAIVVVEAAAGSLAASRPVPITVRRRSAIINIHFSCDTNAKTPRTQRRRRRRNLNLNWKLLNEVNNRPDLAMMRLKGTLDPHDEATLTSYEIF